MMTKKQARAFVERICRGERPRLPEQVQWLVGKSAVEIAELILHEKSFDYGTRARDDAKTLQLMGLLDKDYNHTVIGEGYNVARCHALQDRQAHRG